MAHYQSIEHLIHFFYFIFRVRLYLLRLHFQINKLNNCALFGDLTKVVIWTWRGMSVISNTLTKS